MSRRFGKLLCGGRLLAVALICWLTSTAPLWAKQKQLAKPEAGSSVTPWVMPYALVILGIALGMLVICRSSRRSDRAKPKGYEAIDMGK